MNDAITRRGFLQVAAVGAAASAISSPSAHATPAAKPKTPVAIASGNGLACVAKASELISSGSDTLDAVIAGVNLVEADPDDHSVGLGGLPNENGIVQLDSSVMHGPSHNAGAVAALRNIVHPSRVARLVMQRTDHVLLVDEGALSFARAHGFKETNLLTDDARRIWLNWKETHSDRDDWIAPPDKTDGRAALADWREAFTYGTINCCALSPAGDVSGVTTTSGLSFKLPGRVGDSPIIGAGLYVDNEIGAAGATGRGESVILNAGSFAVVEQMRNGKSPEEACLAILKRVADKTRDPRLLENGKPNFQVVFYAVAKDGRYGSAAMWSGDPHRQFAVCTDGRARLEETACLFRS